MRALARRLAPEAGPLILGIDADAPKTDHPDICRNEWWWDDELLLLRDRPVHRLRDAFRLFLHDHPAELARAVSARPRGPLAVSHFRGTRKRTACRYDFLYVSSGIRVRRVE